MREKNREGLDTPLSSREHKGSIALLQVIWVPKKDIRMQQEGIVSKVEYQ